MLYEKKSAMYAAETAYHGAISYRAYAINNGTRHIDGIDYDWEINGDSICIAYNPGGEVIKKCVDFLEG